MVGRHRQEEDEDRKERNVTETCFVVKKKGVMFLCKETPDRTNLSCSSRSRIIELHLASR